MEIGEIERRIYIPPLRSTMEIVMSTAIEEMKPPKEIVDTERKAAESND